MDAIVIATVAAVGIVAGHRLQQRVVDRAVEHRAVVSIAALHAHPSQLLAPRLLRQRAHAVETEQRPTLHAVGAQVDARALGVHVRDRTDCGHRLALGQVEAEPGTIRLLLAFHAVARTRQATALAPGAMRLERAIELDAEPCGVLMATTEALGDQLALDHAVAHHINHAADHRMALVGLADIDQHMAVALALAEGIALGGGAGTCGGLGIDAAVAGQAHLVVAGLADLAVVAIGRGVGLVVELLGVGGIEIATGADRAGHRQHRHLAALFPAAGAGDERMAEAADLVIVIAPARIMTADRADLNQAERY
ncbi:hypothetical protein G6F59_013727 [Rhizopus arrhizus]|nr:hypothetical protein G6F59_013727 [Rhizopus arrhizus]